MSKYSIDLTLDQQWSIAEGKTDPESLFFFFFFPPELIDTLIEYRAFLLSNNKMPSWYYMKSYNFHSSTVHLDII